MGQKIKIHLKPLSYSCLVMHLIFFWIRLSFLCITILKSQEAKCGTCMCRIHRLRSEILSDIVFLTNFNLFQLYQEASSFVSENIYGYYLSIATMIHNAVLSMFIPVTAGVRLPHMYWMAFGMFSLAFIVETVLSLWIVYVKRFEHNLDLFKKISANPSVSRAFAFRKLLQTFGGCKVFLSFRTEKIDISD